MRYIKLFEQFEKDEWWDEESPFDNVLPRLKIGQHNKYYYILEELEDGNVRMFDIPIEDGGYYHSNTFKYGIRVSNSTIIRISGKNYHTYKCEYGMLPQEIKDRIKL